VIGVLAGLSGLVPAQASAADSGATLLLSRPSGLGALPTASTSFNASNGRSVSADGRFIVFLSASDGLSANDDDRFGNLFLRDTVANTTTLISRSTGGQAANNSSQTPTISADGSRVAFASRATNLDPADTNSNLDVFLHIVSSSSTQLVSRRGEQDGGAVGNDDSGPLSLLASGPSLSADGHQIAFQSDATNLTLDDTNGTTDVFLRDLDTGGGPSTILISRRGGNTGAQDTEPSTTPSVDAAGTKVAFTSEGELDPAADTNAFTDVYQRDIGASPDETLLISRADSGGDPVGNGNSSEPSIANTRVAFTSSATNLNTADTNSTADVHVRDYGAGLTMLASRANGAGNDPGDRPSARGSLDQLGGKVLFETDSTNLADGAPAGVLSVHLRDLASNTTTLVSRASGGSGTPAHGVNSALSADGNHAVFSSDDAGLSDDDDNDFRQVFVRRLQTSTTEFVSRPDGNDPFRSGVNEASLPTSGRALSADGRYIVFSSNSDVLFPGSDEDHAGQVYRRDVLTGDTLLISRASGADGQPGSASSSSPTISADGSRVAFTSGSANLASGDTGTGTDTFVRDVPASTTVLASRGNGPDGPAANAPATSAVISGDGLRVAFGTTAAGLADGDSDTSFDVLLRDLPSATTTLVGRGDGADGTTVGQAFNPSIDFDGDRVAFEASGALDAGADLNSTIDVYLRDVGANTTRLVSRVSGNGPAGNNLSSAADISGDGTRVAFQSFATDLASEPGTNGSDVFVHDLGDGSTALVSRADGPTGAVGDSQTSFPSISADGTKVGFSSASSNLGVDNPDFSSLIYVRDLATGTNQLASRADGPGGAPGNGHQSRVRLNANGDCVAFDSSSTNLGAGGYGGSDHRQIYLRVLGGTCPVPGPPPAPESGGSGGGGQPLPPGATADTLDPNLDRLAMSRTRFRVGSAATPVSAGTRRRRTPAGTRFRWRLSEAATVSLRIERKLAGRRSGRRCVKPTKRNRRARKCSRYSRVGTLTRRAAAGAGGTAFSGRIRRKKLAVGSYRAVVSAKDAAGNASRSRTIAFKIVRR
jgi:Tol biopolymer transport system component